MQYRYSCIHYIAFFIHPSIQTRIRGLMLIGTSPFRFKSAQKEKRAENTKNPKHIASDFLLHSLFHNHPAVFANGNGHAVFDIGEEFIAQGIDNGHFYIVQPHVGQNRAGGCQGVDGL